MKFDPSDFYGTIDFNRECSVPDSINSAATDGWSENWMREHFPECVR
jgi:hypothetical protein